MSVLLFACATLSTLLCPILAAPMAAPGAVDIDCVSYRHYNITNQYQFTAPPALVSGVQCDGRAASCTIAAGSSYAVTITYDTGLTVNLGDLGSISGAVSISHTNSKSITTSETCPLGCQCGLLATAQKYHIEGYSIPNNNRCHNRQAHFYGVDAPVVQPGSVADSGAVVEYSACSLQGTQTAPGLPVCPPFA